MIMVDGIWFWYLVFAIISKQTVHELNILHVFPQHSLQRECTQLGVQNNQNLHSHVPLTLYEAILINVLPLQFCTSACNVLISVMWNADSSTV